MPSTILRKLGTASPKSRLHFAFRKLGRAMRTAFLLDYIGDADLRRTIKVAQNKFEDFNQFTQCDYFGADTIAENVRDHQLKVIKYDHLIAIRAIGLEPRHRPDFSKTASSPAKKRGFTPAPTPAHTARSWRTYSGPRSRATQRRRAAPEPQPHKFGSHSEPYVRRCGS